MDWKLLRVLITTFCIGGSLANQRDARLSFWHPFGGDESSNLLPIPLPDVPVPVPSFLKQEVPDYCKDPLKRLVSFMVSTGVSQILSLIETDATPEFTQQMRAQGAGDAAENVIEAGLTEGNMARAVSRVAAMDLRLVPYFGSSLAARVEPQIESATRTALNSLCSTLNCCFD